MEESLIGDTSYREAALARDREENRRLAAANRAGMPAEARAGNRAIGLPGVGISTVEGPVALVASSRQQFKNMTDGVDKYRSPYFVKRDE